MEKYAYLMLVFHVLEIYCCIWMFQSFAVKRKGDKRFITFVYVIALCCAEWVITNVFCENLQVKAIVIIGVLSFAMYRLFLIRYTKALVLSMLFYGVILVADYMELVVMGTVFPGKIWNLSNGVIFFATRVTNIVLAYGMSFCIKKCSGVRRRIFLRSKNGTLWQQFH